MELDKADFDRLETKVDKLTDVVSRFLVAEERVSVQGQRIVVMEDRLKACELANTITDRKVDQWVNRGIGVWAFAAIVVTLAVTIYKSLSGV